MQQNIYTGIREINLDDKEIAQVYENTTINLEEPLLVNEYLIIKDLNDKVVDKFRWNGEKLIKIKYKNFKKTSILKPLDDIQLCAYDALFDSQVKVVVLTGKAGTGKTRTALSVGMELIKQDIFQKLLILRNPEYQGKDIGFFPGNKNEKMLDGGFLGSVIDNLDGNKFEFEELLRKEVIEADIVSTIKGRNYKGTYIIVDESQDLLPLSVLGVGSRINDESCKLILCGDYNQCAKEKYHNLSGIRQLIEKAKGQDWFVHVELVTNGRGNVASWFVDNYMD